MTPGEFIKQRREQLFKTQQTIADEVGVAVGTVNRWETGTRSPKLSLIPRLATVLGMDPQELLERLR